MNTAIPSPQLHRDLAQVLAQQLLRIVSSPSFDPFDPKCMAAADALKNGVTFVREPQS